MCLKNIQHYLIFIKFIGLRMLLAQRFSDKKKTLLRMYCLMNKSWSLVTEAWTNHIQSWNIILISCNRRPVWGLWRSDRDPDPVPWWKRHCSNIRQSNSNHYRCECQAVLYLFHGLRSTRHRVAAAENPLSGTRPLAIHVPRNCNNPFLNPHSDDIEIK